MKITPFKRTMLANAGITNVKPCAIPKHKHTRGFSGTLNNITVYAHSYDLTAWFDLQGNTYNPELPAPHMFQRY